MALPTLIIEGGTIVAEPELRFTPNGAAVANFRVACNSRTYDKQTGQWEDGDTTFLTCSAWNYLAQNIARSLEKGMRVNLTGRLRQRQYQTKDGENRTVFDVDVTEIGPSLKFAEATVTRNPRNDEGGNQQQQAQSDAGPWGGHISGTIGGINIEMGGSGAQDEEPPFR